MKPLFNYVILIIFLAGFYQAGEAQQSGKSGKILVVEKTSKKDWQVPFDPIKFKEGQRVIIVNTDKIKIRGKINYIGDSSITVGGTMVPLSRIRSIKIFRGAEATTIGATLFITCVANLLCAQYGYPADNDYHDDDSNFNRDISIIAVSFIFAIVGGVETVVGLIQTATVRKYTLNDGDKIYIITEEAYHKISH